MDEIAQGTEEWRIARLGCATASRFGDILATTKTGYSTSRANYMAQLVLERLTGEAQESYVSPAMLHGTETEPLARMAFEAKTGLMVNEVGFIKSAEWIGCSPDGLIDADAGLEIKAPIPATHLETLLNGKLPPKHIPQIQGSMWVTGRERWHFVSFDDRFPKHLRMFHTVVERDQAYIDNLEKEVNKFLAEVALAVERLAALQPLKEAA